MIVEETHLKGCFLLKPEVYTDERGYFFESFNKNEFFENTGLTIEFVQDNQSRSSKGVLRGLHFQIDDFEQAKLVRVIRGSVLDVCVDLRPDSPTFGRHYATVLDAKEHHQLFIPRGFAHGFLVQENNTIFSYKCDNFYNKDAERGIIYNDKDINIDWNISDSKLILSEKDKNLPSFKTYFNR